MARPKYKIGNLVRHGNGEIGVVDGVLTRADGFRYTLENQTEPISEDSIGAAYREVKPRAESKPRAAKQKSSGKNKTSEARAQ